MTISHAHGSTPRSVPSQSGGATVEEQIQWIQTAQEVAHSKAITLDGKVEAGNNSIKELSKELAGHGTGLAVLERDISHIRDSVTGIKQSLITEATLRTLHTEMLDRQHKQHVELLEKMNDIQSALSEKITEAKESAAKSLKEHEAKARSRRYLFIGLLCSNFVALCIAYFRLKG